MDDAASIHRKEYEISDTSERIAIAQSPARLNIMGEFNRAGAGVLLAATINRQLNVCISARKDNSLRFFTAETSERKRTTILNIKFKKEERWANHAKLAVSLFADLGYEPHGLNFTITGNIPQNIGLAGACAVEVASTLALKSFYGSAVPNEELVQRLDIVHKDYYAGEDRMCDFLVMLNAKPNTLVIADEKTGVVKNIKDPAAEGYRLLLLDSRVPFFGADDEMRNRRNDLNECLRLLRRKRPDANDLQDFIGLNMLELMDGVPEEIRRRCLHVIQELNRIKQVENAITEKDIAAITRDIYHSHESLRDLYEVSCPEVDWLVKRAQEMEGVLGARMTGNGFGGCVFVIMRPEKVDEYLAKMDDYERIFGFAPKVHEISIAGGASILQ
jgi:galactokinase